MRTIIYGGTLLTPDETLPDHALVIEAGHIVALEPGLHPVSAGAHEHILHADGLWVAPGLIDLHVHGSAGSDTMDATPAALAAMSHFFIKHGVTAYLPTTITAPGAAIQAAITNVERTPQPEDGAHHLGVHLEGPYLSPTQRGAQPEEFLRQPDPGEYDSWLDSSVVCLIAVAPEISGVLALIERGGVKKIRFSAGHCQANYEQMMQAVDRGLNQATHTFNAMLGLHHREPGTAGAVLADERIYAEVIVDGIHVHPAIVRVLVHAKGINRTILITDAIRAAGLADGDYDLGGQIVHVADGIARTSSGSLAGSTLTLDKAVRNVMQFAGVSLNQALAMASRVPAEAMRWSGRKGVLEPGADADVILFDASLNIRGSIVAGNLVYDNL
jgi:N-acetylglucosamine-6-phosphate deacetylase